MGFDNISTRENPKLTRGEIGHIIGYRLGTDGSGKGWWGILLHYTSLLGLYVT